MKRILEVCVDSYESAMIAKKAGASRLELCSELSVGGITPSYALIKKVREISDITLNVLIRPRSGDFTFSDTELELMLSNIKFCKQEGVDGVVIGALNSVGNLDIKAMKTLIKEARPMSVTFHRAFDWVNDPRECLKELITLKVDRVLTSGQAANAYEGIRLLKELNQLASDKIIIMPGAGVNKDNIAQIVQNTKVKEIHSSGKELKPNVIYQKQSGIDMGNKDTTVNYRYIASYDKILSMVNELKK